MIWAKQHKFPHNVFLPWQDVLRDVPLCLEVPVADVFNDEDLDGDDDHDDGREDRFGDAGEGLSSS